MTRLSLLAPLVFLPGCLLVTGFFRPLSCGDGLIDRGAGEECDDTNAIDADGCESDCTLPACGNNVSDPGEFCPTAQEPLAVDPPAGFLVSADFDQDGLLDLALTDVDKFTLLFNRGESFAKTVVAANGAFTSLSTGDFNGDGAPDLAATDNINNAVFVLLSPAFNAPTAFGTGVNPAAAALLDFESDGSLDIAVANFGENTISLLRNTGNGSFVENTFSSGFPSRVATGDGPIGLVSGDFDGNGIDDLAVLNRNSPSLSFFSGGGLTADGVVFSSIATLATSNTPRNAVALDINGDENLDIAAASEGATQSVFFGNGVGGFSEISLPGNNAQVVNAGDIDGDGLIDLLLTGTADGVPTVLLNQGGESFAAPLLLPTPFSFGGAISDLNQDNAPDIAVTDGNTGVVLLLNLQ